LLQQPVSRSHNEKNLNTPQQKMEGREMYLQYISLHFFVFALKDQLRSAETLLLRAPD